MPAITHAEIVALEHQSDSARKTAHTLRTALAWSIDASAPEALTDAIEHAIKLALEHAGASFDLIDLIA